MNILKVGRGWKLQGYSRPEDGLLGARTHQNGRRQCCRRPSGRSSVNTASRFHNTPSSMLLQDCLPDIGGTCICMHMLCPSPSVQHRMGMQRGKGWHSGSRAIPQGCSQGHARLWPQMPSVQTPVHNTPLTLPHNAIFSGTPDRAPGQPYFWQCMV